MRLGSFVVCLGVAFATSVGVGDAFAHGGGLNSDGCHNNRKTGDYHCHRASRETATPRVTPASPGIRPGSVTCMIKDKRVTAASAADCTAIGGRVQ